MIKGKPNYSDFSFPYKVASFVSYNLGRLFSYARKFKWYDKVSASEYGKKRREGNNYNGLFKELDIFYPSIILDNIVLHDFEDDVNNKLVQGNEAMDTLAPIFQSLTFDASTTNEEATKEILQKFNLPDNYQEFELEVKFSNDTVKERQRGNGKHTRHLRRACRERRRSDRKASLEKRGDLRLEVSSRLYARPCKPTLSGQGNQAKVLDEGR